MSVALDKNPWNECECDGCEAPMRFDELELKTRWSPVNRTSVFAADPTYYVICLFCKHEQIIDKGKIPVSIKFDAVERGFRS